MANCPGISIHVQFVRIEDECDVWENQLAQNSNFHVEVSLNPGRIRVEEVELPYVKGADLKR